MGILDRGLDSCFEKKALMELISAVQLAKFASYGTNLDQYFAKMAFGVQASCKCHLPLDLYSAFFLLSSIYILYLHIVCKEPNSKLSP